MLTWTVDTHGEHGTINTCTCIPSSNVRINKHKMASYSPVYLTQQIRQLKYQLDLHQMSSNDTNKVLFAGLADINKQLGEIGGDDLSTVNQIIGTDDIGENVTITQAIRILQESVGTPPENPPSSTLFELIYGKNSTEDAGTTIPDGIISAISDLKSATSSETINAVGKFSTSASSNNASGIISEVYGINAINTDNGIIPSSDGLTSKVGNYATSPTNNNATGLIATVYGKGAVVSGSITTPSTDGLVSIVGAPFEMNIDGQDFSSLSAAITRLGTVIGSDTKLDTYNAKTNVIGVLNDVSKIVGPYDGLPTSIGDNKGTPTSIMNVISRLNDIIGDSTHGLQHHLYGSDGNNHETPDGFVNVIGSFNNSIKYGGKDSLTMSAALSNLNSFDTNIVKTIGALNNGITANAITETGEIDASHFKYSSIIDAIGSEALVPPANFDVDTEKLDIINAVNRINSNYVTDNELLTKQTEWITTLATSLGATITKDANGVVTGINSPSVGGNASNTISGIIGNEPLNVGSYTSIIAALNHLADEQAVISTFVKEDAAVGTS